MTLTMGKPKSQKIVMGSAPKSTVTMGSAPKGTVEMAPSHPGWGSYYDQNSGIPGYAGTLYALGSSGDPNAKTPGNDLDIGDGGGGGGITAPVGPTQAQLDPILASLKELDTILANKNKQSRGEYQTTIDGYDEQDALDRAAKDKNVFQNESTYTGNNQAALLNAANAYGGLRGVLASLGGLAGSGTDVVNRLVGLAANQDTGASRKNFDVNAETLNTAWSQAERDQRQRRIDADAILKNNLQNNEAGVLTSRQQMYQQLANMYGPDHAQGNTYASKASALAAPIARTTQATVAPYAKASSLYSPGALESYLAGTQNLNVNTSGNSESSVPINSPLHSRDKRRDSLAGVA